MRINDGIKKIGAMAIAQPAIISIVVLFIIGYALYGPVFLNVTNIFNILRLSAILAILAMGLNIVIITGGIDLSGAAIFAIAGVFAGLMEPYGDATMAIVPIVIGFGFGLVNGFLVTKAGITPFIATLASGMAIRGFAYIITDGGRTAAIPDAPGFFFLATGVNAWIFSMPLIIAIILCVVLAYVLKYRPLGRHIYAIGGNMESARMVGVDVHRVLIAAYAIAGVMAAVAGVIMSARLMSGMPTAAQGITLEAIASVMIGGTLLTGGKGHIAGSIFGAIVFSLISNLINTYGDVNAYTTNFITGALVLALALMQARIEHQKNVTKIRGDIHAVVDTEARGLS